MKTMDDTFKKLADPTYTLRVIHDPNLECTGKYFDKIINSDLILTVLGDPDYIADDGNSYYYNLQLEELINEVYNIGESNIRIEKRFKRIQFIHFYYNKN